jgi:hypothetical protein
MRPIDRTRPLPVLLAIAALVAAGGCGLFTPAEPNPPGGGDTGVRLPVLTVSPDSAIYSWETGLELKNETLYMHGITESTVVTDLEFHAFFDPQDAADYEAATGAAPPSDWRSPAEKTFFSQFAGYRPVTYQVFVFPDTARQDERNDNEAIYYRRYRVYAGTEPIAFGLADIVLRRVGVNQEWKIVLWTDRRDTTATIVRTLGRQRLDSYSPL